MDEVDYWKRRATAASDEYDELVVQHRTQTEALRRQCAELLHERSLMKAATASDVRAFVLNYQTDALRRSGGAHTQATDAVPINKVLQFLHEYSNGLVPAPRGERKRDREVEVASGAGSPTAANGTTQQRLYQRLMLRRRQNFRECEMDEWIQQQKQLQQQQQQPAITAPPAELEDSAASLASPRAVAQQGGDVDEMTAQLRREERERQLEDDRAHEAHQDPSMVVVGGVDGHGSRRPHTNTNQWSSPGSNEEGSPH